ncbi:MAG: molybdopterin-guanine dinucleotide biosynthesis protein B [Anaerolineae bacterium]
MIPIISVVGKSEVGKTTLLEKLIAELKRRGYRLGTIKHDTHGFEIDKPGKDSWRHAQAGSDAVLISSPEKLALIKRVDRERSLDELLAYLGDVDLVLTEGYKSGDKPKIEVSRQARGQELLCHEEELLALVTDQPFDLDVPQFEHGDVAGLADLIEKEYLMGPKKERVSLVVDGREIPLRTEFAAEVVKAVVKALVSTLHGTEGAKRIVITLEDEGEGGE